ASSERRELAARSTNATGSSRVVQRQDGRLLTAECGFESYLGSHFRGHRLNGLGTSALIRGNAGSSPAGRTIRTTEDGRRRTDDCSLLRRPSSVLRRLLPVVAQLGSAPGRAPGGRWFEPS